MNEWLREVTLWQALKFGGVIFLYALMILFVIWVILAMVVVFG